MSVNALTTLVNGGAFLQAQWNTDDYPITGTVAGMLGHSIPTVLSNQRYQIMSTARVDEKSSTSWCAYTKTGGENAVPDIDSCHHCYCNKRDLVGTVSRLELLAMHMEST
jgi:hypothetical protein